VIETEPVETIHLYVVREDEKPNPPLLLMLFCVLVCLGLIETGFLNHATFPTVKTTVQVPAIFLPPKYFTASVSIIPTGIKTYPATTAYGTLTLTNGSVVTQEVPQGMIFPGRDGSEVGTNEAIVVPAGSADGYGVATVSAHALISGQKGNLRPFTINQVYGTSLFVRNLQTFTGGREAYSVKFVTAQDRKNALNQARSLLIKQTFVGILARPCREVINRGVKVVVTWKCQFATYSVPSYMKVIRVRVFGKNLLVDVVYEVRHRVLTTK
jgi:hypothetical protein